MYLYFTLTFLSSIAAFQAMELQVYVTTSGSKGLVIKYRSDFEKAFHQVRNSLELGRSSVGNSQKDTLSTEKAYTTH